VRVPDVGVDDFFEGVVVGLAGVEVGGDGIGGDDHSSADGVLRGEREGEGEGEEGENGRGVMVRAV
jgi:hypothetical protein